MAITSFPTKIGSLGNPDPTQAASTQETETALQGVNTGLSSVASQLSGKANQSALATEVTARANGDAALSAAVSNEATVRANAVSSEATARANAVSNEATARANADAALAASKLDASAVATDPLFPAANSANPVAQSAVRGYVNGINGSTNYYINTSGGNDANDGRSLATAWATVANVSRITHGILTLSGSADLTGLSFSRQAINLVVNGFSGQISGGLSLFNSCVIVSGVSSLVAKNILLTDRSYLIANNAAILRPLGIQAIVCTRRSDIIFSSTLNIQGAASDYCNVSDSSTASFSGAVNATANGATPASCQKKISINSRSSVYLAGTFATGIAGSTRDLEVYGDSRLYREPVLTYLSSEYPNNFVENSDCVYGWLDRPRANTTLTSGKKATALSTLLYEDKNILLTWNSTDRQVQFNLKTAVGWTAPHISQNMILGSIAATNGNNTVRATSGPAPLVTGTARHFSRAGTIDNNYNLSVAGSVCTYAIWEGNATLSSPFYAVDVFVATNYFNFLIRAGNPS